MVAECAARIDRSKHALFDPKELKSKSKLTEEEWFDRTVRFVEDPANEVPNTGIARDLTRGLLTKLFADHLGQLTVAKFATVVQDYPAPKKYKGIAKPSK